MPVSPRRRLVLILMATSPVWLGLAVFSYLQYVASSRLHRAVAEADRTDPNWRLADLERTRIRPPDDRNSALVVLQAYRTPRKARPGSEEDQSEPTTSTAPARPARKDNDLENRLLALSPEVRPDPRSPRLAEGGRSTPRSEALALARTLTDMGEGRYPVKYSPVIINTLLGHLNEARGVARLLQEDAIARAEAGDVDGAVGAPAGRSSASGESIGDEKPFLISQARPVRGRVDGRAVVPEGDRSRGSPRRRPLPGCRRPWPRRTRKPLLVAALRGERATTFDLLHKLANGDVGTSALAGEGESRHVDDAGPVRPLPDSYNQGLALDLMNRAVAIARRRPARAGGRMGAARRREVADTKGILRYFRDARLPPPAGQRERRPRPTSGAWPPILRCGRGDGRLRALPDRPRPLAGEPRSPRARLPDEGPRRPLQRPAAPDATHRGRPLDLRRRRPTAGTTAASCHPRGAALPGFDIGVRLWDPDRRRQPSPPAELPKNVFAPWPEPTRDRHARHHPHLRRPADPERPDRQARPAPVARGARTARRPLGRPEDDARDPRLPRRRRPRRPRRRLQGRGRGVGPLPVVRPPPPGPRRLPRPDPAPRRLGGRRGGPGDAPTPCRGPSSRAVSQAGYRPADDRFHPHVTGVGRVPKGAHGPGPDLRAAASASYAGLDRFGHFAASEVVTYASTLDAERNAQLPPSREGRPQAREGPAKP